MPKIIDTNKKKYEIMKAAMMYFHSHGISRTSLADIAEQTERGRTSFYNYFKSKAEVLDVSINYILEITGYDYELYIEKSMLPAAEKITLFFSRLLKDIQAEKEISDICLEVLLIKDPQYCRQREKLINHFLSMKQLIKKIIDSGIYQNEFIQVDSDQMAHSLLMFFISILISIQVFPEETVSKRVHSLSLLINGLCKKNKETRTE